MTVQPAEAPTIDLELLVGDMPEVPCDHPRHFHQPKTHGGPATHYVKGDCAKCGGKWKLSALCERFMSYIMNNAELRCSKCDWIAPASQIITILGPVNK